MMESLRWIYCKPFLVEEELKDRSTEPWQNEMLTDFKARSRSIEILHKPKETEQKILTRVFFDFNPLVSC